MFCYTAGKWFSDTPTGTSDSCGFDSATIHTENAVIGTNGAFAMARQVYVSL